MGGGVASARFPSLCFLSLKAGPPRQNAKLMSSRRIAPAWRADRLLSINSLVSQAP